LPPLKKNKFIALKVVKEKSNESSDEELANDDRFAMLARSFRKMINSSRGKFRSKNVKFSKKPKGIMNLTKRIYMIPDVMSAQGMVVFALIAVTLKGV
jgi:hypothetical protein